MTEKRQPVSLKEAISGYLVASGLSGRLDQVAALDDWPKLVGARIAAVTTPVSMSQDGVMFVGVKTHAWMSELSLMEPALVAALNSVKGRAKVTRIRFLLRR